MEPWCELCSGSEDCVYMRDPVPKWAYESQLARLRCQKLQENSMPEDRPNLMDDMNPGIHDDRLEMSDEDYKEKINELQVAYELSQGSYDVPIVENSPKMKRVIEKEKEEAYQRHCKEMDALDKAKEKDEDGLDQHEPGAKLDHGKVDIYRHFMAMFPDAMACVAGVSDYGERKYSYMGWAKVSEGKRRYTAALCRHLLDEARGEVYDIDPDKGSDLAHAAQAAWNAMARLQLMIQDGDVEIRQGRELKK